MRALALLLVASSFALVGCPKKNKPPPVRELYMGPHVTCAQLETGQLRCQGRSSDGALGPAASAHGPSDVPFQGSLLDVRIGERSVCLVLAGAPSTCFGVVDPALDAKAARPACTLVASKLECDPGRFPVPPKLEGLAPIAEVASGRAHACLRFTSKTVACFGDNTNAQLASARVEPSPVPLPVQGVFGAEQIVAAGDGTCARLTDKTVRCWGKNDDERLSVGRGDVLNVPAPVHF